MTRRTALIDALARRIAAAVRRERRLTCRWHAAVMAPPYSGPVAWRAEIVRAELALARCQGRRAGLSEVAELLRSRSKSRRQQPCN